MHRARTIMMAGKAVAATTACTFLYVQFLTTPVPRFLSLMEWSIIGIVVDLETVLKVACMADPSGLLTDAN